MFYYIDISDFSYIQLIPLKNYKIYLKCKRIVYVIC